jgi:hypothetical protein
MVPDSKRVAMPAAPDSIGRLRELARKCDRHAAALGVAVHALHTKLTEPRMRVGRGPSALTVTSSLERCTRLYLGNSVMRGLPGSPRLPMQSGFSDTVERWLPSLRAPNPPSAPPPPPPPAAA